MAKKKREDIIEFVLKNKMTKKEAVRTISRTFDVSEQTASRYYEDYHDGNNDNVAIINNAYINALLPNNHQINPSDYSIELLDNVKHIRQLLEIIAQNMRKPLNPDSALPLGGS